MKIKGKTISFLVGALALSFASSLSVTLSSNKPIKPVEASVGNYSRNQATYYTSAFTNKVTSSKYGTTLLNTLHELMYETHGTYNTYDDLWDYTKYTDPDIDNPGYIVLVYSRQSIDETPCSTTWNREHVWCKSLSGGLYDTTAKCKQGGSDIHHLRPASTAYNSTRGNTPYGIVATHDSTTKMGSTDCYLTSSAFEPADYIKGDVARILMYMYTHYSTEVSGTSTYSGALAITNVVYTSQGTAQAAWNLLMDWNEKDPVDYQEMIRNNEACKLVGNYNPFIDHPEYARMIWDSNATNRVGLSFQTSYKTVSIGSTYTNTASAIGNTSSVGNIVYTSDNPDIATVSNSGLVRGVSNGVARIKARTTINGSEVFSYHFVVVGSGYQPKYTNNASGVVYTPTSASTVKSSETLGSETVSFSNTRTDKGEYTQMVKGQQSVLTINNFPKTIKKMTLWMHSNKSAGAGSITITVGGSSYKSVSGNFNSIYGSYTQEYVPVDVTNASASKKTGTIVITISVTTNSFFFLKAVIDYTERAVTLASSISVSPSSISMAPGEDNMLTTNFTPSSTTLKSVTWSTSNSSVATVSKYGLVRAIAEGSATITATAADGSNVKGTTAITVTNDISGDDPTPIDPDAPTVTSVTVSPASLSLDLNGTKTGNLTATVVGTNNPATTVTWESGNPSVATVNSSGVVTAIAVGSTTISATSTVDGSKSGSATVTVTDSTPVPTPSNAYKLVYSTYELLEGCKVVIGNSANQKVMGPQTNTNYRDEAAATYSSPYMTVGNDATILTVGKSGNYYTFNDSYGYISSASSSNNYLKSNASITDNAKWDVSINSTNYNATMTAQGSYTRNVIFFNSTSTRFSCYASTSTMKVVQLYADVSAGVRAFVAQFMHMSDYTGDGTGLCAGANGYYAKAKEQLQRMGQYYINELCTNNEFSAAATRLSTWASKNGETFDTNAKQFSSSKGLLLGINDANSGRKVIGFILITMTSTLTISYFIFRKRIHKA